MSEPSTHTENAGEGLSDREMVETVARWCRQALSPGTARQIFSMALRLDVRSLLPSVACPTLVLTDKIGNHRLIHHHSLARLDLSF